MPLLQNSVISNQMPVQNESIMMIKTKIRIYTGRLVKLAFFKALYSDLIGGGFIIRGFLKCILREYIERFMCSPLRRYDHLSSD